MPVDTWDSTTAHWDSPAVLWDNGADTTPPSTPTSLVATAVSAFQINLSWTASTDNIAVGSYEIRRGGVLIAVIGAVNFYSDTTVTELTLYSYTVTAVDTSGNHSSTSSPASATTPSSTDTIPPTFPSVRTATAVSGNRIDLSWSGATDNIGVTGYEIYRSNPGGLIATVGAITSYSDTTVLQLTTYVYNLKALDAAGNASVLSPNFSATTPASVDISPPSPPNVVTAAVSSTRIDLSWSGATDNVGVTGYQVYRNASLIATLGTITTYIDSPLAPSTTYTYTVRALDAAGNRSGPSPPATGTTPDPEPILDVTPPTVVELSAVVSPLDLSVTLNWTASTDDVGVTNYEVFRNGVIFVLLGDVLTYTDTTLVYDIVYTYTVRARDGAGNVSVFSGGVNATIPTPGEPEEPPPPPDMRPETPPTWGADRHGRRVRRRVLVS